MKEVKFQVFSLQAQAAQLALLIEAEEGVWEENKVIRSPDGKFARWQQNSGFRGKDKNSTEGRLVEAKPTEVADKEVINSQQATEQARGRVLDLITQLSQYKDIIRASKGKKELEDISKKINQSIDDTLKEIQRTRDFEEDVKGKLVKDTKMQADMDRVAAKKARDDENQVNREKFWKQVKDDFDSLRKRQQQDKQSHEKAKESAGKVVQKGADKAWELAHTDLGKAALATTATVGAIAMLAAFKKNKIMQVVNDQMVKQAVKGLGEVNQSGAITKVKTDLQAVLAKQEDVAVVGKMLKQYRIKQLKARAGSLSKVENSSALQKAEKSLRSMIPSEFEKTWEESDDLFKDVPDVSNVIQDFKQKKRQILEETLQIDKIKILFQKLKQGKEKISNFANSRKKASIAEAPDIDLADFNQDPWEDVQSSSYIDGYIISYLSTSTLQPWNDEEPDSYGSGYSYALMAAKSEKGCGKAALVSSFSAAGLNDFEVYEDLIGLFKALDLDLDQDTLDLAEKIMQDEDELERLNAEIIGCMMNKN